jgi:hypothetical protein
VLWRLLLLLDWPRGVTTASRRVCGHERISGGMGSRQRQRLQPPAFGDRQVRQMGIRSEPAALPIHCGWETSHISPTCRSVA